MLGYMGSISLFSAFLLELVLLAFKSTQLILSEKITYSDRQQIKEALVTFVGLPIPKEYKHDIISFANQIVLKDLCLPYE